MQNLFSRFLILLFAVGSLATPAMATPQKENLASTVQTTWRLLDYVAVDYASAVAGGRVISKFEYAEMEEFAKTARSNIETLPSAAANTLLVRRAQALEALIAQKCPPAQVNAAARSLAGALLEAYPVPLSPRVPPSVQRGRALYSQQCAVCHGTAGGADGPAAAGLDPPPIAFTDVDRARERSIFALYQVIAQGLEGTAMADFKEVSEEDRWALALYSGQLAFTHAQRKAGERLWQQGKEIRALVPDLEALVRITPAALAERIGRERADLISAYLRGNPSAVIESSSASLDLAQSRLDESVAAYVLPRLAGCN